METSKTKKTSLLFLVLSAITALVTFISQPDAFQPLVENELVLNLKSKLLNWHKHYTPDKVYLHLDKTLYEPGENIWISAYVCNANILKPSVNSEIAYVELIGPKGNVEKKLSLVCKKGKAAADFNLASDAPGGLYKLRAYTNWMKNEGESNVFEKSIQVQDIVLPDLKMKLDFERKAYGPGDAVTAKLKVETNDDKVLSNENVKYLVQIAGVQVQAGQATTDKGGELYLRFNLPVDLKSNDGLLNILIPYNGSTESVSRSIPIVLNHVGFEIFPEGGDLVAGINNHIAFRAKNEFGKPADVEGVVVDGNGKKISGFKSFHNGMGAFELLPQDGRKYYAKITKPAVKDSFMLPMAWNEGMVLHTAHSDIDVLSVNVNSTRSTTATMVAQMRGNIVYSTTLAILQGSNSFSVATNDFPTGVMQLTLFDAKGIERAERLCFINRNKQLSVSITTDKQKYLPREKVKMTIMVKDENGMPAPGRFSLAVVNDQLLSFADDKSGNILSQLLLEDEINEKIEEPAFYFNAKEKKSEQALDYLLMTAGWRRFTWERLQNQDLPAINFMPEKAKLSGVINDGFSGQPIKNVKVKWNQRVVGESDESGKFSTSFVDLSENTLISFECEGYSTSTQGYSRYASGLVVNLFKPNVYQQRQIEMLSSTAVLGIANRAQLAPAVSNEAFENQKVVVAKKTGTRNPVKQLKPERNRVEEEPVKLQEEAKELAQRDDAMAEDMEQLIDFKHKRGQIVRPEEMLQSPVSSYHRARQFASPVYTGPAPELRTDFRSTVFWLPDLEVNHSGRKNIEFYLSDDVSSFRTILEGISHEGLIAHSEQVIFSQLPFSISCKLPEQMVCGDKISLPVVLRNNTSQPIGGLLTFKTGSALVSAASATMVQTLMPGEAKTVLVTMEAKDIANAAICALSFNSCGFNDAVKQEIKISAKGFPVQQSFSAQDVSREYEVEINHLVKGSLRASFSAYPNVITDLLKGVEGILQEPYGCFEQTSCTAYPNAMVLDYLKHTGSNDAKLLARAEDLLNKGYNRLTTFETPGKGYEWFGANPAHEGLTAYGIMEFVDMHKAGQNIDKQMLDRTVNWLMSHRDGKGGFAREQRALHDFGRISDDVMNGYIVYALSEAGYKDFEKEFTTAHNNALNSSDAYLLAMNANAAYALGKKSEGDLILTKLVAMQNADGSFKGSTHSITYSQGLSLSIETTALAMMAMIKSGHPDRLALNKSVGYLVSSRSASGVFSSTQGTILALKSLTQFAKFSKRTAEAGTVKIYIDNKKVAETNYGAGHSDEIKIEGLEKFMTEGKRKIRVEYNNTKQALPYSLSVNWSTNLPTNQDQCALQLKTKLIKREMNRAETVRLNVEIINKTAESVPSSVALIGIPSGLSLQPWQLKELQEKAAFDYYEIKGNVLAVYYRGLAAHGISTFGLDLKADIPGNYEAPASCAYLYYNNEWKSWSESVKINIH